MEMDGGSALLRALEYEGVEVVFGYPGGAIMPVYDSMVGGSGPRHVLVRHEQGAGHMASGYAHATGKPGVVMVTSGPAATNIVTARGIATNRVAHPNSSRMPPRNSVQAARNHESSAGSTLNGNGKLARAEPNQLTPVIFSQPA